MFVPVAKILKRFRVEKIVYLVFYLMVFSSLAFYHKERFLMVQNVEVDTNVTQVTQPQTVAEVMTQRVKVMQDACRAHGLDKPGNDSVHKPYPWEYLINEEHNLVWCNIFKCGSTSWLNIFNTLRPLTARKRNLTPVSQARENYIRPSVEQLKAAMNKSETFIVGRNPLERLVSGYRDKIVNAVRGSEHDRLRREIVQRFRVTQNVNSFYFTPPTFAEFVQFIVNEDLNDRTMDMHWEPVYKFCTPCQFQFTDIIKMETFSRDQEHILDKAGIKELVGMRKDNVGKGGETSEEMTSRYLRELPPKLFEQLLKIYRYDFEIFGYDLPKLDIR